MQRIGKQGSKGFTLMEVIGVLAVIAIIAAVATPQIFQAIQDAKVTALVQEANDLKAAVARYYKDTGTWPRHIPSSTRNGQRQLMVNRDRRGNPITGWDGPYLDGEMTNPIVEGGYMDLNVTNNNRLACDLDGDGTTDGTFITLRVDGVDDQIANDVSSMLDKDGDDANWKSVGRVKRFNGNHRSRLIMCLARV